jgi:hypothetical protein
MYKIRVEVDKLMEQTRDKVPLNSYKWVWIRIALFALVAFINAVAHYIGEGEDDSNI